MSSNAALLSFVQKLSKMGEVDALQDVYHLTNLNDVNRLLHETLIREQCIDAELETLQSKRESIDRSLLTLQQSTVEVHYIMELNKV